MVKVYRDSTERGDARRNIIQFKPIMESKEVNYIVILVRLPFTLFMKSLFRVMQRKGRGSLGILLIPLDCQLSSEKNHTNKFPEFTSRIVGMQSVRILCTACCGLVNVEKQFRQSEYGIL